MQAVEDARAAVHRSDLARGTDAELLELRSAVRALCDAVDQVVGYLEVAADKRGKQG
jgi:hypothetical protein